VAPIRIAVSKAWREFSGACARPPRWANRIGSRGLSAERDTGPVCPSPGPSYEATTHRLNAVDGVWLLVAFGLVAAVVAVARLSLVLTRELVLAAESLSRLGRLSLAVRDLVRSARRLSVDVGPVGRR